MCPSPQNWLLANFLALFPSKAFLELYPILFLLKNGHVTIIIRDPARGTNQFCLRVAWTSAFKQFVFLY